MWPYASHSCEMHRDLAVDLSPALRQRCLQLAASQGRLADLGLDEARFVRIIDRSAENDFSALFADPDGNALMLHHRYKPRV